MTCAEVVVVLRVVVTSRPPRPLQATTTGPYFYGAATLLQIYKYAHSSIYLHHDPFSRYDFHNLASLPVDAYTRKKSALKTVEMMEICNMCLFRVYKSVEKNLFGGGEAGINFFYTFTLLLCSTYIHCNQALVLQFHLHAT